MTVDEVAGLLSTYDYVYCDEDDLQRGVSQVLLAAEVPHEREFTTRDAGRIDFRVGSVGIEIKVADGRSDVLRQLHRYATSVDLPGGIVLVTSRSRHALDVPPTMNGRPLRVVLVECPA